MGRTISKGHWKTKPLQVARVVHPTKGMVQTNTIPLWMFKHSAVMQHNGNALNVWIDCRFQITIKLNDNTTLHMIRVTHPNPHSLDNGIGLTIDSNVLSAFCVLGHLNHFCLQLPLMDLHMERRSLKYRKPDAVVLAQRMVRRRGGRCQVLTNGQQFLKNGR